jgi:esterase/lipase superfamily enzyme
MLVFGHSGVPVVLFPTSQARTYEHKDFRLIEAVVPLVDAGRVKLYCNNPIDDLPRLDDPRWDMFPRYLARL